MSMARTVVGLDIGSSGVRAAELTGGRAPSLVNSGFLPLPQGAVEAGSVRNARMVTQTLKELWHDNRIKNKDVRIGIGSGSVLVRQLELDWMPPADLRKALRYQVADLLPVSVDDANIDHITLDDYERLDPELGSKRRFVRILLVATARGAVDEMVRCVQAAGLRPRVADLSAFGLVRSAARAGHASQGTGQTEAIVDIGSDKVAVAVHTAGRPHFVRVVAGVGGSTLTRALVEGTGRSWQEAEEAKRAATLPLPAAAMSAMNPLAGRAESAAYAYNDHDARILLDGARQLVAEVKATLDFHASTDREHPPERVLLTGGGAALAGLTELTRITLELPARRFEPSDVLPKLIARRGQRDPLAEDTSMTVPIGLALGASV
jgi:type IV pilus assembly protein PilM